MTSGGVTAFIVRTAPSSDSHPKNASSPINVTPDDIHTSLSELQPLNAHVLILLNLSGSLIVSSEVIPWKAPLGSRATDAFDISI